MLRRENIVMLMDDEKKVQEEWIVSGDNKGESAVDAFNFFVNERIVVATFVKTVFSHFVRKYCRKDQILRRLTYVFTANTELSWNKYTITKLSKSVFCSVTAGHDTVTRCPTC